VQAYNRGVRAGADQVVDKYEKQCITQFDESWGDDGHQAIVTASPMKHLVWKGGWTDDGHGAIVTASPTKHPVWQGGWNDGAIMTESPTEHPTKHPTWHGDEWGGAWGDDGYEYKIVTDSPTDYPVSLTLAFSCSLGFLHYRPLISFQCHRPESRPLTRPFTPLTSQPPTHHTSPLLIQPPNRVLILLTSQLLSPRTNPLLAQHPNPLPSQQLLPSLPMNLLNGKELGAMTDMHMKL
jgi:hypothetical protein